MYSIVIPILIAIFAGSCIFGKKFWENRLAVLGIAGALMLVTLTSATMIARKNLPTENSSYNIYTLNKFYIADTMVQAKLAYVESIYTNWDANEYKNFSLKPTVLTTKTLVGKSTYKLSYRYANQRSTNLLVYFNDGDTLVGFIKTEDGNQKFDYYKLENIKIASLGNDTDKPVIRYIAQKYKNTSNWTFSVTLPNIGNVKCIYLPNSEYNKLPGYVRSKCYYSCTAKL
jgi:hypothetical protein